MYFNRQISFLFFIVTLFFIVLSHAQENSPASPSSSYNNEYNGNQKLIKEEKKIIPPKRSQIVVQGNSRLDSSVIVRDSLIDINKTQPKDLSIAIKNLYKTGYYENVNIFKNDTHFIKTLCIFRDFASTRYQRCYNKN